MCVKYSAPLTWGKSGLCWHRLERRKTVVAAGQVITLESVPRTGSTRRTDQQPPRTVRPWNESPSSSNPFGPA